MHLEVINLSLHHMREAEFLQNQYNIVPMSQEISPPPNICPPGTRFLGHTGAWQKKEPPIKIVLVSIIIK